jgi:Domain of unknown function (DUF6249)
MTAGEATGLLGLITGLMSAVMSLGIGFWWIYWSYRKKQLQYQERQLMIEKGLTPPPILERPISPEGALRRGTLLFCLGIGLGLTRAMAVTLVAQDVLAATAAIVGFLGVGYLLYYFIVRGRP